MHTPNNNNKMITKSDRRHRQHCYKMWNQKCRNIKPNLVVTSTMTVQIHSGQFFNALTYASESVVTEPVQMSQYDKTTLKYADNRHLSVVLIQGKSHAHFWYILGCLLRTQGPVPEHLKLARHCDGRTHSKIPHHLSVRVSNLVFYAQSTVSYIRVAQ